MWYWSRSRKELWHKGDTSGNIQKIKEKIEENNEVNDLLAVLDIPQGRRVLWRILEECKTFGSIYETSARIHYNAGQQDIGHMIMAKITEADEEALFTMMRENQNKP